MVPQKKSILDGERTENLPAQEKVTAGYNPAPVLSAEQAYAQQFAESPQNGDVNTLGYIP